ncbi:MAG: Gfo/Idh/MocA family oxidoreductase [Bryobacterales bacterium]|nr:Gfo/Idh/MocA family oxidoreductase [Bryobacterales bacterium]
MPARAFINRRNFLQGAAAAAVAAVPAKPQDAASARRVIGANDRINLAQIGVGGRGSSLQRLMLRMIEGGQNFKITAVCDVYEKRRRLAQENSKAEFSTLDYREVLARPDVDAVVIATPDHWHGTMALAAIDAGLDVYLEKPMTHTIAEAKAVARRVRETGAVLQVGSQTTSADQWWKARKALQDGMIGTLISSQGSYHRNSLRGEWNWTPERGRGWVIEPDAGPHGQGVNYIDWNMWLGPAQKREWDPHRFFRFRKYWDYSGGIATDLFYHVVAPLNICWGEAQFPYRVTASGGKFVFNAPGDREVPDTMNLLADFAEGHTLVLSASMANSRHIPGLIRGHEGTIVMVEHGRFEGRTDYITVEAEAIYRDAFVKRYGTESVQIKVEDRGPDAHMKNFLECMRTRAKPNLDADTAYRAQTTISMGVMALRQGKVLYFDPGREEVTETPPRPG